MPPRYRRWIAPRWGEAPAALLFCVLAVGFAAPVLRHLDYWGIQDWDFHLHHHAVARLAVVEHGEFPLWNPYNWSGTPLFGHPLSRVLAPTFLLTLLFGEVIALKLEIPLHLALGMLGAHLLLRRLEASRIASATAAVLFMLNSWYALHISVGHVESHAYAYLPWAFLFYRNALDDLRWSLALSLVLVLTLFGGAPYQVVVFSMLLVAHSVFEVVFRREHPRRHVRLGMAVAVQVVLLGAVKLLPTLEVMTTWPRRPDFVSSFTPAAFLNALFDRAQTLDAAFTERRHEFNGTTLHEGMYVGFASLLPFVLGVWVAWRRQGALLACLVLFTWISLGDHVPLDLRSVLLRLPVFDNMRMFQRFGMVVLFAFSVFAGLGMDAIRERLARRTGTPTLATAVVLALGCFVLVDLALVNVPIFADAFTIPPRRVEPQPEFRQTAGVPVYGEGGVPGRWPFLHRTLSGLYPATLANQGSTRGYRSLHLPSAAVPADAPGYRGEVFLEGRGSATLRAWSLDRIAVELEAPEGGLLVVNQNFAPGWGARAEGGAARAVRSRGGRLAVEVRPEDRGLEVVYRPTSFVVGTLTSLAALPLLTIWLLRRVWPGRLPARPR
jgi:hypothetical protein